MDLYQHVYKIKLVEITQKVREEKVACRQTVAELEVSYFDDIRRFLRRLQHQRQ